MTQFGNIGIGAHPWLDYLGSTPSTSFRIAKAQRYNYSREGSGGFHFYNPALTAIRRAISSTEPPAVLEATLGRLKNQTQLIHTREVFAGFLSWWNNVTATAVPAKAAVWARSGLSVSLYSQHLLGLKTSTGVTKVVLPYVKPQVLTRDAAFLLLHLMEQVMPTILDGATPAVLDRRRARSFALRKNTSRTELDAILTAEAARYVTHWHAAA